MIAHIYTRGRFLCYRPEYNGITGPADVLWRCPFRVHTFRDGRTQAEMPCPRCVEGTARVTSHYAPDKGRNWWQCDDCDHRWV